MYRVARLCSYRKDSACFFSFVVVVLFLFFVISFVFVLFVCCLFVCLFFLFCFLLFLFFVLTN